MATELPLIARREPQEKSMADRGQPAVRADSDFNPSADFDLEETF